MISRFLPHPVKRLLGVQAAIRPPGFVVIDQPGQLQPLLEAISKVDEVSLDTEADNMFHYRVRVCLLQFLVAGDVYLVDVLAPINLDPLWALLADKHLVMHGSDFDLRLLHDRCKFRAKSLFDTMLAPHDVGWDDPEFMGASLDHCMWFHRPFRADEWLLYDMDSPSSSGARGLARGFMCPKEGTRAVSRVQEGLMRLVERPTGS